MAPYTTSIDLTNTLKQKKKTTMKFAFTTVEIKKKEGICLETEGVCDNFMSVANQ